MAWANLIYKSGFIPTLLFNLHKSTFNKLPNMTSSNLPMLCDYAACDWERNLGTQSGVRAKQRDIINAAVTLWRHWLSKRVKSGQESEPASQREESEHERLCACLCESERDNKTLRCVWDMRNKTTTVEWLNSKTEETWWDILQL